MHLCLTIRRAAKRRLPTRSRRLTATLLAVGLGVGAKTTAQAQDLYFAQPYATRLHTNPAFTGLFDDYSVTLSYRNQFPTLAGTFQTAQLAADYRLQNQRNAIGLLLNTDRTGGLGYTRIEVGGLYAYRTQLTRQLSLSAGVQASYGNQRVSYGNLLFGDQLADDGTIVRDQSAEALDYKPMNYLTLGTGLLLYTEQFWISAAAHHVNQPDLGFVSETKLPMRLNFNGGFKHFFVRSTSQQQYREVSLTPTFSYTSQGGSQRAEAGIYTTFTPITVGAVYRGVPLPGSRHPQQLLTVVAGVSVGAFRLGYSYDASLSALSAELGGAQELTLSLRQFDSLEEAWRRLKRRNYPVIPCPAF